MSCCKPVGDVGKEVVQNVLYSAWMYSIQSIAVKVMHIHGVRSIKCCSIEVLGNVPSMQMCTDSLCLYFATVAT